MKFLSINSSHWVNESWFGPTSTLYSSFLWKKETLLIAPLPTLRTKHSFYQSGVTLRDGYTLATGAAAISEREQAFLVEYDFYCPGQKHFSDSLLLRSTELTMRKRSVVRLFCRCCCVVVCHLWSSPSICPSRSTGLLACFVPLNVLLKRGQSVLKKGQQAIIVALFCVDAQVSVTNLIMN